MDRKVYFGNSNKQTWINAPQTGLQASSRSFISEQQLLSGRTFVKRSRAAHRRFTPSWLGGLNSPELHDSLQTIKDFADGVYGDGPFYFNDPYATSTNLLPPNWAAPGIANKDWPNIASFAANSFVNTASNINNYPPTSVEYSLGTGEVESTKKLTLIIPTGYTLHFGWHGEVDSGDGGVRVKRFARTDGTETTVDANVISVTSSNRTNVAVSGDVYSKVEIYLYKPDTGASVFTVSGMIAQLLKGTNFPEAGGFISGRGTTGIEFAADVSLEYYSSTINNGQVGLSTEWIEV